jgi:hypothetical protein
MMDSYCRPGILLLLLLLTVIEMSFSGSSPYTSTYKTNKTIKNTVQTIRNTANTSIHVNKTPPHYKTHTYTHTHTHPHITKQVKTTTLQVKRNTVQ